MDQQFMKAAGNHSATSTSAALAANAARPPAGQHDMSEPLKVTPSMGSQTGSGKSPTGGTPLSAKTPDFPQTPTVDSGNSGFPSMAAMNPLMNYPGGFPASPYPMMPYPMMDPMMLAAMGKGMAPMYPMMPMGYPGMMGMMPMQGGKNQSKGQGAATDKRRARPNKKKKDKDEAVEVDESSVVRSPELTEVRRAGQGKSTITLNSVMGQVVDFAVDQHGSRFLQQCLDSAPDAEKAAVLEAMLPQMNTLAKDQYANFVIQKLFDIGSAEQRKAIAEQLQGQVVNLSMDQHGCRVIQKALQLLPREAQMKLALEIQDKSSGTDKVRECIENMHGNHVIQKCIEQMPPDSVNFIIESVSKSVDQMAEHMYGCRIIQRLLEHCAPHQLEGMLEKIKAHTTELAKHLYGNYVVQHMLEHGRQEDKKAILDAITLNVVEFAKSKCSSNVVEKCFEIASIGEHADALREERQRLYAALLTPQPGNLMPIKQLTDDKFGNYIVQRMIEYSRDPERGLLQQQLINLIPELQKSTNGKHICNAISKEFNIQVPTAPDEQ
jgi:pumilio RNA-binding family|mmetsp:Transcript_56587/g.89873  ORF Transcript_56587/g.89873 Transcript_56587/m.89873 type:complete len:550 (+) Transcript_56587:64-1713(+)